MRNSEELLIPGRECAQGMASKIEECSKNEGWKVDNQLSITDFKTNENYEVQDIKQGGCEGLGENDPRPFTSDSKFLDTQSGGKETEFQVVCNIACYSWPCKKTEKKNSASEEEVSINVTAVVCTPSPEHPEIQSWNVDVITGTACGPVGTYVHASGAATPLNCYTHEKEAVGGGEKCCDSWSGQYCTRLAGDPPCTTWKDNEVGDASVSFRWKYGVWAKNTNAQIYAALPQCP